MNILENCTYCIIDLEQLAERNPKAIEEMKNDGFDIDEDVDTLTVRESDLHEYNIPYEIVDNTSWDFDWLELEDLLLSKIDKHPHYLVMATHCRWNGASGYKFCENITDTVQRGYEITLVLEEERDRAIKCRESSHDVPMGSTTYIIGISEEEYEKLSESSFEEVQAFAEKIFG